MAQATFKTAIEFTLPWEVGKDKNGKLRQDGGINYLDGDLTKWGLFRKYHPWLTEDTPLEKALDVYKTEYWDWYKLKTPSIDLDNVRSDLAVVIFDTGVNCSTARCYRWSLQSLKEKDPTKYLLGLRKIHYATLKAAGNPTHVQAYNGWINRLNDLTKLVDIIRLDSSLVV